MCVCVLGSQPRTRSWERAVCLSGLVIIKGTVSSLVLAFPRSPRPATLPGLPSTKVALTTYVPIYTLSCCRHSASPRSPRIPLSLGYQFPIIHHPAIVGLPHTQRRGVPSRSFNWCVCVPGNHQQRTPNCPDSLHRAAAAAPDNVSSRPFCCLQQRAPPPWFCPFFHVPAAGAHICSTSPANIDVVNPQPKR